MEKRTGIIYVANDGKEFINEKECVKHEEDTAKTQRFTDVLKEIKKMCAKSYDCENCMFEQNCPFMNAEAPEDWDV